MVQHLAANPIGDVTLKHQSPNKCGLCGSTQNFLRQTECCKNWLCGPKPGAVAFARDYCIGDHHEASLCAMFRSIGHHHHDWRTKCEGQCEYHPKDIVWYGLNGYN